MWMDWISFRKEGKPNDGIPFYIRMYALIVVMTASTKSRMKNVLAKNYH